MKRTMLSSPMSPPKTDRIHPQLPTLGSLEVTPAAKQLVQDLHLPFSNEERWQIAQVALDAARREGAEAVMSAKGEGLNDFEIEQPQERVPALQESAAAVGLAEEAAAKVPGVPAAREIERDDWIL